jgi:hypothetical protein
MTLPASGSISFSDVNIELGNSSTQTISLNDSGVRTLFGVPSGSISINVGYGKSNRAVINYIISSSTQELSLTPSSFTGYIAGKSDITITVNSGVYVWSDNTSNPGLIVNGGLSSGDTLKLVNNGYIIGKGGDGGLARNIINSSITFGKTGGPALKILTNLTIDNYSYIAGGGGGGGAGTYGPIYASYFGGGGGGAGGGRGAPQYGTPQISYVSGGTIGNAGDSASTFSQGGGGGRILPGVGGVESGNRGQGGGAGGSGGGGNNYGGDGGSANNIGGAAKANFDSGGGGGGWGAAGGLGGKVGVRVPGEAGGSGGKAIDLNGYSVTYINQGTVWGAVS